jgi:hypothetical protein
LKSEINDSKEITLEFFQTDFKTKNVPNVPFVPNVP